MKNPPYTVQNLRQNGYKVRVIHRMYNNIDGEFINVDRLANDGNPNVTQIEVTTPDKTKTVFGFSFLHTRRERYFTENVRERFYRESFYRKYFL